MTDTTDTTRIADTASNKKVNEWRRWMRSMGIMLIVGLILFGLAWLATIHSGTPKTVWPLPHRFRMLFFPNFVMGMAWCAFAVALIGLIMGSIVAIFTDD